jgi:hypothetical protein
MKTTEEMFWECFAVMQKIAEQYKLEKYLSEMPTPDAVTQYVAARCGVTETEITSKSRKAEIVEARQLLSTMLKFGLKITASNVGIIVGNFDHATVLHSIKEVSTRYNVYPAYRKSVNKMVEHLFKSDYDRIIERIIDPSKDRKESMFKFVGTVNPALAN